VPNDRSRRYLDALEELREWSRAREYSDRAIEHMKLALDATNPRTIIGMAAPGIASIGCIVFPISSVCRGIREGADVTLS